MIETLFILVSIIAVSAGGSQIYRLLKVGRSDELSVSTWSLWLGTQVIQLVYMVSLQQPVLVAVSSLWTGLYVAMVGLILYYRRHPRLEAVAIDEA